MRLGGKPPDPSPPTMNDSNDRPNSPSPRGFRRVAPAFVLFFMAPYVAEYLLGNLSIGAIVGMIVVAPLYGGGAVVIREVARRTGRGWPTIVLLAFAYGLLEEGLSLQTLFNPNYLGLHLLQQAYIPSLGIGGWWTVYVLALHVVWSICVPIALTEALFAERRTAPWLGYPGLGVSILLFLAGLAVNHALTGRMEKFSASPLQLGSVAVLIVLVVTVGFLIGRKREASAGFVPRPWQLGALTFAFGLLHRRGHLLVQNWALVALLVAGLAAAAICLRTWSTRAAWTPLHLLSAAGGAAMSYAVLAFPQEPSFGPKGTVDLVGNVIFGALAVVLLVIAFRTQKKALARGR
jgi:hypothetical protein